MDDDTKKRVESTVMEILRSADMEQTTEYQIRSMAADRLDLDLSLPDRKKFVRRIVEAFLLSMTDEDQPQKQQQHQQQQQAEEEKETEEKEAGEERQEEVKVRGKEKSHRHSEPEELDDEGNPIICHLSNKRRVTVQEFRGKKLVSIREYYEKDGRQLPSSKGISLTTDQWEAFKAAVPGIEAAIARLK